MAITVLNEPAEFTPIYHAVYFRLDSTLKGSTNFKYIFKITVGTITRKINVRPEPVNGYGVIDIQNHLKDFLNEDIFDITATNFQDAARTEYVVKIDEEFIDGLGIPQTNVDAAGFTNKIAYNSRFSRNEYFGDLSKIEINTLPVGSGRMLLNIKPLTTVYMDDIFFIHFVGVNQFVYRPHSLQIYELNNSGGLLATHYITGDLGAAFNSQLITMDLGQIAFNSLTKFIQFRIVDTDTNQVTTRLRLRIEPRECSTFEPTKLIYLDAKGSYNSLNFDGTIDRKINMKTKTFRKFINPLTDNPLSRGIQKYFIDSTEVLTLHSFVTEDNKNIMFEDLIKSPRVFMDLRNNAEFDNMDFAPVEILERRFKEMKTINGDLPEYEIDIRFAFEEVNRL